MDLASYSPSTFLPFCKIESKSIRKPPEMSQSDKITSYVLRALNLPKESLVIQDYNIPIRVEDLKKLDSRDKELNNSILEFYMQMIVRRSKNNHSLPKVFSLSTYFYKKFVDKGYDGIKQWNKKCNLFSYDMIFGEIYLSH